MPETEKQLGFETNRNRLFVGTKRNALCPRAGSMANVKNTPNLIIGTHFTSSTPKQPVYHGEYGRTISSINSRSSATELHNLTEDSSELAI